MKWVPVIILRNEPEPFQKYRKYIREALSQLQQGKNTRKIKRQNQVRCTIAYKYMACATDSP